MKSAIIAFVICFIWSFYSNRMRRIKEHKAKLKLMRAQQVLLFRETVLMQYDMDIYNSMPTYEDMLQDKKDLTFANYVKIDKVINMN